MVLIHDPQVEMHRTYPHPNWWPYISPNRADGAAITLVRTLTKGLLLFSIRDKQFLEKNMERACKTRPHGRWRVSQGKVWMDVGRLPPANKFAGERSSGRDWPRSDGGLIANGVAIAHRLS